MADVNKCKGIIDTNLYEDGCGTQLLGLTEQMRTRFKENVFKHSCFFCFYFVFGSFVVA